MENTPYTLVRSHRKTISVEVKGDGRVIVRAPQRMLKADIDTFVRSHEEWIMKHLLEAYDRWKESKDLVPLTKDELHKLADEAMSVIPPLARHYAEEIGVTYNRITIRNQRTKWGSCSGKGNLNFNCLLMLAPREVLKYIIVHELCHRKEMNHSKAFYREVERVYPDYRTQEKWLKEHGDQLLMRNPVAKRVDKCV